MPFIRWDQIPCYTGEKRHKISKYFYCVPSNLQEIVNYNIKEERKDKQYSTRSQEKILKSINKVRKFLIRRKEGGDFTGTG